MPGHPWCAGDTIYEACVVCLLSSIGSRTLWGFLWGDAPGFRGIAVTQPECTGDLSAPRKYWLGNRPTGKEKGRGTLQTSALPLGYGAEELMPAEVSDSNCSATP